MVGNSLTVSEVFFTLFLSISRNPLGKDVSVQELASLDK